MPESSPEKIRWAPKVRQAKIWQLYQNDSLGTVDESLVEDVGYMLLQRVRSIKIATFRQVECPRCGNVFALKEAGEWRLLPGAHPCPTSGCGWETTAAEWHASWRHHDLLGLAGMQAVETYLEAYPKARSASERMLCIDQLIHAFHISLRSGKAGRSFANNLIEGSHQQVIDLLDRLFDLPGGVDKTGWREEVKAVFRLRRGQDE